jgi:hypothetical protein
MKLQVNEFPHFLKVAYNNTLADLWDWCEPTRLR